MLASSISVYTPNGCLDPWDKSKFHSSVNLLPECSFLDSLHNNSEAVLLIEGSLKFVSKYMPRINHNKIVILILNTPRSFTNKWMNDMFGHLTLNQDLILKTKYISHDALGGVTSQFCRSIFIWKLDSNSEDVLKFDWAEKSVVQRSIYDLVEDHARISPSMIVPGPNVEISSVDENKSTKFELLSQFILPSIWSETGWVKRHLSEYEIMNLLDITQLRRPLVVSMLRDLITRKQISSGKICQLIFQAVSRLTYASQPLVQEIPSRAPSTLVIAAPEENCEMDWESEYLLSYGQKKAKEDDAPVPIELWDRRCISGFFDHFDKHLYDLAWFPALTQLRKLALRLYRRNIYKSFVRYLNHTYGEIWKDPSSQTSEIREDLKIGRDALTRAVNASWWEWKHGSTLFFWRWPKTFVKKARDGVPIFIEKKLPCYKKPQTFRGLTSAQLEQMKEKLLSVVDKGYIVAGFVLSLTNYFAVPKGENDIRMVYDGTQCGLNDAVFAPNFFLPSINSLLNQIGVGYWFSDFDLGEMFLNYFIHHSIRHYCGVDLTKILGGETAIHKRWERTYMGFRASPYNATQSISITLDVVRGDPSEVDNPFRWDNVQRNLPGMASYDPSIPWVRQMYGDQPAAGAVMFVDDGRPFAPNRDLCIRAGQRCAQLIQYLGQQVAARKYIPPSMTPGPWTGAFITTRDECLWLYVSQEKWEKGRNIILGLFDLVVINQVKRVNRKQLEKDRGFLVHLSQIYPSIVPYLKGIHLTLESWRCNRDDQGWKLRSKDILVDSEGNPLIPEDMNTNSPQEVDIVPRLSSDLTALEIFFSLEKSPWRFVRGKKIAVVQYGFGDASKAGFGASLGLPGGDVWVRSGTWGRDEKNASSNFRELANLVETLELRAESNLLQGLELFIFTDNSTAEGAFYKGTSSSRPLFELILKLRQLEFHHGCKIYFIHVSGKRMIAQGTDGISRGDMQEGILSGVKMLSFVPLHLTCLERSLPLKDWFSSWLPKDALFLETKDWFFRAHNITGGSKNIDGVWIPEYKSGIYVWTPSPAEGMIAVEQLRQARTKHTDSTHVLIIPRLFTSIWRKQLNKVGDVVFQLPFNEFWSSDEQFEPLIIAVVFPFISSKPWQLKRGKAFLGMEGYLRGLLDSSSKSQGNLLRKFFESERCLASLSPSVAWEVLQSPSRFFYLHSSTRRRTRKRVVETSGSEPISGRKRRRQSTPPFPV